MTQEIHQIKQNTGKIANKWRIGSVLFSGYTPDMICVKRQ